MKFLVAVTLLLGLTSMACLADEESDDEQEEQGSTESAQRRAGSGPLKPGAKSRCTVKCAQGPLKLPEKRRDAKRSKNSQLQEQSDD